MNVITTNEGSLINTEAGQPTQTIPRGQQSVTTSSDSVIVTGAGKRWVLPVDSTTVDGVSYGSSQELANIISSFRKGGGAPSEGVQKATIEQMQAGTNDEAYVTPYGIATYVSWFSESLIVIDEEETEPMTSAQVNTKYPEARLRTIIYFPNVGSGLKYTKITSTTWESQPYTVA